MIPLHQLLFCIFQVQINKEVKRICCLLLLSVPNLRKPLLTWQQKVEKKRSSEIVKNYVLLIEMRPPGGSTKAEK
jgi:hypothetical protein